MFLTADEDVKILDIFCLDFYFESFRLLEVWVNIFKIFRSLLIMHVVLTFYNLVLSCVYYIWDAKMSCIYRSHMAYL